MSANNTNNTALWFAALAATCPECDRVFDLLNADDAAEWGYGHDCE